MRDRIYEDISVVLRRARVTWHLVGVVFLLLVLYFWKIQVLDHKRYWELSEANRISEVILSPQRGLIRDREGKVLATNIAAFQAAVVREKSPDLPASYRRIGEFLGMDPSVVQARVERFQDFPAFYPIVIKDDLDEQEVARIDSRRWEFPELVVGAEPKRSYPEGSFAAHVIGYLQEISPDEIRQGTFGDRRLGDLVGRTGIEHRFETELGGKSGRALEIVDSTGRVNEELSRQPPRNGTQIDLTLDARLQAEAESHLEGREGAIVVMDPRNGEILALASYPTFDPNKFINRFTPEEWMAIINHPNFPLENRALRGLYSPGSIFKLVMATAALDSGLITERTSFFCSGSVQIYGHPFNCWFSGGHGRLDLYNAIRFSCNIYFYQLGKRLGIETIADYARMFGLGRLTGIDISGEYAGLVPDPEWKRRVRKAPWYPGETISVSIGQGPLQVTPLQIACLTAAIANRGRRIRPHLRLQNNPESTHFSYPNISVNPALLEKIIQGMWMSANREGTSRAAGVAGMEVCGKTGSTQVVSRRTAEKMDESRRETKTHSWFSGFAPRTNAEVVVTVIVEYGGMGGSTAAPMARELFRRYQELYR
jgi:penicillin-binding protein 2